MMLRTVARATIGVAVVAASGILTVAAQEPDKPGLGPPIQIHMGLSDKEWPQLQNTPQRTGYSPVQLKPPYEEKWRVFLPMKLGLGYNIRRCVQPVITEGKVYVGCTNGRFLALDAKTGEVKWEFEAGGAVLHTAGCSKGKVFFGTHDGCVYAVDTGTGKQIWKFDKRPRYGFFGAVLLAEGRVFAADLGGRLYALDPESGKEVWHYDAEAPVMQTPAYNDERVYFADEELHVHAVRTSDGSRVWRSKRLHGKSFIYYWPVVVHGKVIVRSMNSKFAYLGSAFTFAHAWKDPVLRDLYVLDEKTGREDLVIEHYALGAHSAAVPPPAVTRDGYLVIHWSHRYMDARMQHSSKEEDLPKDPAQRREYLGGLYGEHCWALQDLKNGGKLVAVLDNEKDKGKFYWHYKETGRLVKLKDGVDWYPTPVGASPADECIIPSVIGEHGVFILGMSWRHISSFYKNGKFSRHNGGGVGGSGGLGGAAGTYSFRERKWFREGIREVGATAGFPDTGIRIRVEAGPFSGGVSAVSAADGRFYSVSTNGWVQCLGSAAQ